jgi:BON domain
MAGVGMPQLYGRDIATGGLAHYFDRRFFIKPTCSAAPPVYPEGMDISSSNRTGGKSMKFVPQVIVAKLLVIFSLVLGCQTITEMTRRESDKDAAISKAVKETFLKDKAVDLTDVNVRTTDGSVDLRGTVPSLEAREHAIKLAWKVAGVEAVVNHLEVKK